jgi:hypothetical protein
MGATSTDHDLYVKGLSKSISVGHSHPERLLNVPLRDEIPFHRLVLSLCARILAR